MNSNTKKLNVVFLSGHIDPLHPDNSDRRFMPVTLGAHPQQRRAGRRCRVKNLALFLAALLIAGCATHDDSDPVDGRSGFSVFHDNLTGCEYVGWSSGIWGGAAITPRLKSDGKQVCRGSETSMNGGEK